MVLPWSHSQKSCWSAFLIDDDDDVDDDDGIFFLGWRAVVNYTEWCKYPVFTLTRLHSVLETALLVCIIGLARGCGGVNKFLFGGNIVQAGTHARAKKQSEENRTCVSEVMAHTALMPTNIDPTKLKTFGIQGQIY